jgi:uncharacterized protein (DUF1015 family)
MAGVQAFRAYRFDLGRVGNLSDVVCPPYDVIDEQLQQTLYDRSPYNAIRLELNRTQSGDTETQNCYSRSAGFLRDWLAQGIIKQDSARSLYVCHQEYEVDGRRYIRKGFLARVRLEPLGDGHIFAHEETMPGPKADRLKLLRATGMNLSPIFGLYPDESGEVQQTLEGAVGRGLPLEATDHLGVKSRLWQVSDQKTISRVAGLMGNNPIFIADGHHRYETGLNYLNERRQAGDVATEDSPANYILMNLVAMSDPGLMIMPTHRLISGLPGMTGEKLRQALEEDFDVEDVGAGQEAAAEAWDRIQIDEIQNVLGFGSVADGKWQLARLRDPAVMKSLAPEHGDFWRALAVSVLHVLVLGKLLNRGGNQPACRYVHKFSEVRDAVTARSCDMAVLVPPATMRDMELIAGNLEKMPAKSTYFYPKLLTGLVFNSLRGH